jgi:N-acetyl-anhydromuramyl-L-alanine amidase AmpD
MASGSNTFSTSITKGFRKLIPTLLFGLLASQPIASQEYDIAYGSFRSEENAYDRLEDVQVVLGHDVPLTIQHDDERNLYRVIGDYSQDRSALQHTKDSQTSILNNNGISDQPFFIRDIDFENTSDTSQTQNRPLQDQPEQRYDINYGLFKFISNARTFRSHVSDSLDDPISIKVTYNPSRQQYQVYGNYDLTQDQAEELAENHFYRLVQSGIIANDDFYRPAVIGDVSTSSLQTSSTRERPQSSLPQSQTSQRTQSADVTLTIGTQSGAYPSLYRIAVEVLDADTNREIESYIDRISEYNDIHNPSRIADNTTIRVPQSLEHLVSADEANYSGAIRSSSDGRFDGSRPPMSYSHLRSGGPSRNGESIDMIILHTTDHRANSTAYNNLNYIARNNSAHYFVSPNGTIYAITDPRYVSHGAGRSLWQGEDQLNNNAINIEIYARNYASNGRLLASNQRTSVTDSQYGAIGELVSFLQEQYDIPDNRVLGHSQVAYPRGRKLDPGTPHGLFDWEAIGLPRNGYIRD